MQSLNQGRPDAAIWLLEHGADPSRAIGAGDLTPLHGAATTGATEVVRWILDAMERAGALAPDVATTQGYTPLHMAAQEGHAEVVAVLMSRGASPILTLRDLMPSAYAEPESGILSPVFSAAGGGHVQLALEMLSAYFGPAARARAAGVLLNRVVCRVGDEAAIRLLLAEGADPCRLDVDNGWAPIHWAASLGNDVAIRVLVESGVQVDQRTADALTALAIAQAFERTEATKMLRGLGADADLAARLSAEYGQRVRVARGETISSGPSAGALLAAGAVAAVAAGAVAASSRESRDRMKTFAAAAGGAMAGVAVKEYLDRPKVGETLGLIEGECVRAGEHSWDSIAFHLDGNRVIRGEQSWGDVVATIDGTQIRRGDQEWGEVFATVSDGQVRAGSQSWGDIVATIDGTRVLMGDPGWIRANVDGDPIRAGALAAALVLL